MGIADLPDIDEDEWRAHQADTFRRATGPISASSAFMASTEPLMNSVLDATSSLSEPLPEPPPRKQVPLDGMAGGPFDTGPGGPFGGGPTKTAEMPFFGGQQADPSALFDELTSFDGDDDLPSYKAPPPVQDGLGGLGQMAQQAWQGDPAKPGFFSWAGQQVGNLTDRARNQGFTQNNPLGTALVGAGEGIEGALHGLGGSAQALREGNVVGGLAGTASAALNAVGDIPRGIATEGQWPTRILPGIDPETPVIGGLNNPRELVGLATDLLIPETAIERMVGKGIGKVAKPALEAAGGALQRAGMDGAPAGIVTGEGRRQFHGSATPFGTVDPTKFDPDGLYGPGYYTTSRPEIAETYTEGTRGLGQAVGSVHDWSPVVNAQLDMALDLMPPESRHPELDALYQQVKDEFSPTGSHGQNYVSATGGPVPGGVTDYTDQAWSRWNDLSGVLQQRLYDDLQAGRITPDEHDAIHQALGVYNDEIGTALGDAEVPFMPKPQPNIRPVDVQKGTRLLDIDSPVPPEEVDLLRQALQGTTVPVGSGNYEFDTWDLVAALAEDISKERIAGRIGGVGAANNKAPGVIGNDYYLALIKRFSRGQTPLSTSGDAKKKVNEFLSSVGFDGVTHKGGLIRPITGADGQPVLHQVDVIFPDKLDRVRNALSGEPGGITSGGGVDGLGGLASRAMTSPFFSPARTGQEAAADIGLGTAGGVGAAATAEEDATWQERAGRFALGAAAGAGIGATSRATLGRLARDETGSLNIRAGMRQGIPDFKGARPPIEPEEWEAMTPRQRRNARDAAEAGRPYTPLSPQQVAERRAMREAERIQDEVHVEEPDLAPVEDALELPPAEPSGDVLERVLSQMTPEGKAAAESWEKSAARLNAGWMKGFVRASEEAPWEGGQRYDRILELASGEKASGEQVARAMAEAEEATSYEPPKKLTRREKERLGNLRSMEQALSPDELELAERLRNEAVAEMKEYHGFRTSAESKQAADNLMPFLLQFARNAQPNEPVSEALMLAGRQARAHATALARYAELDWIKTLNDPDTSPEAKDIAKQAFDYWEAAAKVFARYGGEVAPSESGRTFRSMRTSPEPLVPTVAGGSGEVGDTTGLRGMGKGMAEGIRESYIDSVTQSLKTGKWPLEKLPMPEQAARVAYRRGHTSREDITRALYGATDVLKDVPDGQKVDRLRTWIEAEFPEKWKAPQGPPQDVTLAPPTVADAGPSAPPTNRGRITGQEKEFMEMLRSRRKVSRGELESLPGGERSARRAVARRAGKRPGGDLDVLGLEWSDVMKRTGNDDDDRVKMLAGLGDLGGYRFRRDWTPRLLQLDLDDAKAVEAFWKEARAKAGVDEKGLPYVAFDPNVEGQSYLGGRETLTRAQAVGMVSKRLIKDADEATRAVREARAEGALEADIADLEVAAKAAYERLGLNIDEWPEDSFPMVSRAFNSVRDRIEREWPKDRPAGSKAIEDVEKKRQLLGLLDQAIKKENPAATWTQDALSFGTSNVLMTPRFVQASILESALSTVNEPFQDFLRGDYARAGQRLRGIGRAFGVGSSADLAKLGEGIKAPALVNALKGFQDIGPMQAATELRDVSKKGAGMIRSDSANPLMKLLAPMHRISRGISEGFQTANYFGEVNRLAHEASEKGSLPGGFKIEQVSDEGTSGLRNPTVQELLGNLPQEIVDEALKASKKITEGGDPGVIEKKIGELKGLLNKPNASSWERTQGVFANLMFPFVYGLRPMIRSGTRTLFSAPVHGTEAARALLRGDTEGAKYAGKKFALANAFNGYIAWQVMSGNITGHGPSDPATRQALMEATDENGDPIWRPDSIRLPAPDGGHFWTKYTSLPGPVSIVATVMGNLYDAYAFDGKDMETAPETAARMAQQLIPSVLDNTYMRDFINLTEAMNANGGGVEMGRVAGQVAGRFVPGAGALRTAAMITDPYQRITENPLQDIQGGIPGLRQMLPAQVSAYTGEPVENRTNPLTALGGLSGNIAQAPSRPNPMAREVAELRRRPLSGEQPVGSPTPRTFTRGEQARGAEFAGQRQTGEAIRGAQEEFGRESGRQLLPVITSPEYQRMTPEQKAATLERVIGQEGSVRPAARYAAEGRVDLPPERQLERRMEERPQFMGVSGSPQEIAAMNQRVKSARDSLAQLSTRYGRDMAMALLAQQAPEALQLALSYPPMNRDLLWMQEQQEARGLGIVPEEDTGTFIPDFGGGSTTIAPLDGATSKQQLPPSLRRILG
jgi:hypothetical protein